jgi:hypothetical protein
MHDSSLSDHALVPSCENAHEMANASKQQPLTSSVSAQHANSHHEERQQGEHGLEHVCLLMKDEDKWS